MGWLYLSSESHHFLEAPLSKPPPFVHVCAQSLQSCLTLCDPLTVACQAPLSMEFSRKECWSVLACPPLGDCPYPGIKPTSPTLAGRFLPLSHLGNPFPFLGTSNGSLSFLPSGLPVVTASLRVLDQARLIPMDSCTAFACAPVPWSSRKLFSPLHLLTGCLLEAESNYHRSHI